MSVFSKTTAGGIQLWVGNPDCQTAHNFLLGHLVRMQANFIGATEELGTRRQGNIGEFIGLRVAYDAGMGGLRKFAANATNPLNTISKTDLDICYILFHESDESRDIIYIQEVKTTFGLTLSYADTLAKDFEKLFGGDPNLTLQSRMQVICTRLEIETNEEHLCERALALAATKPAECTKVRLIPTLVHERVGTQPAPKLVAVRTSIISQGWNGSSVDAWSIAFTDLEDRLTRLARGMP